MKNLVIYQGIPNYFRVDNRHIFINFNKSNLDHVCSMPKFTKSVFHIIITNHESINDSLKTFIGTFGGIKYTADGAPTLKKNSKIIIHIPERVKHLRGLVDKFLFGVFINKYKVIVDKDDIVFRTSEYKADKYANSFIIELDNKYYKSINAVTLRIQSLESPYFANDGKYPKVKFPMFPYETPREEEKTIFNSAEERLNPEMFKDKIIDEFKKQIPESILGSFKDDDDIWNYINVSGEWKIH